MSSTDRNWQNTIQHDNNNNHHHELTWRRKVEDIGTRNRTHKYQTNHHEELYNQIYAYNFSEV